MVAIFNWVEYLTSATSTATPTNLNLGSTLSANLSPTTYPVTAGTCSYEKWLKAYFSGTFTSISNIKFWKSAGSYVTGEIINWTGQKTAYVTPTNAASTYATSSTPISEPASANVGISGTTTGSLTSAGYSDFMILQASVTTNASSGAVQQKTFSLSYDET